MWVYNLTDKTPPGQSPRRPQRIKVLGKLVPVGSFIELHASTRVKDVAGLVSEGFIAIDEPPAWYQVEEAPLPLPDPSKKKRRKGRTAQKRREEALL